MAHVNKQRIDSFRFVMCSVIASAMMAVMLYLHGNKVQEILSKLAEKGKLDNVEWLVEYASYFLPVAIVAIAITAVYSLMRGGSSAVIQKEKALVGAVVLIVTYAIMLPIVSSQKEPVGESEKTLMDVCVKWFAFQFVPLLVMIFYHSVRAEAERKAFHMSEVTFEEAKTADKTEEKVVK